MGEMIGIPFILWLFWTSFEFENKNQMFAFIGMIGLILAFTKYYKNRILRVLIFGLMLTPIIRILTEIPIAKFNYLTFIIPLFVFIITSLVLILKSN
jgi:hypothetical protein